MKKNIVSKMVLIVTVSMLFSGFTGCAFMKQEKKKGTPRAAAARPEPVRRTPGTPGYPKPYIVNGKSYQPIPDAKGFKQKGIASWYGEEFHGKKTSSGEVFDMNKISAAHKTLPLGTYVRIINLENNKSVDAVINDRGPFVPGRIVDLSKAAAKKIEIFGPGTAPVRLIALGEAHRAKTEFGNIRTYKPVNFYNGNFTIQVGAFKNKENAHRLMMKLNEKYKNSHIMAYYSRSSGERFYRVLIGKSTSLQKAEIFKKLLLKKGFSKPFIVAE